jgi:hypothetical protein
VSSRDGANAGIVASPFTAPDLYLDRITKETTALIGGRASRLSAQMFCPSRRPVE